MEKQSQSVSLIQESPLSKNIENLDEINEYLNEQSICQKKLNFTNIQLNNEKATQQHSNSQRESSPLRDISNIKQNTQQTHDCHGNQSQVTFQKKVEVLSQLTDTVKASVHQIGQKILDAQQCFRNSDENKETQSQEFSEELFAIYEQLSQKTAQVLFKKALETPHKIQTPTPKPMTVSKFAIPQTKNTGIKNQQLQYINKLKSTQPQSNLNNSSVPILNTYNSSNIVRQKCASVYKLPSSKQGAISFGHNNSLVGQRVPILPNSKGIKKAVTKPMAQKFSTTTTAIQSQVKKGSKLN